MKQKLYGITVLRYFLRILEQKGMLDMKLFQVFSDTVTVLYRYLGPTPQIPGPHVLTLTSEPRALVFVFNKLPRRFISLD